MKYIEDFIEDDKIVGHYLCRKKMTMKSKSNKSYLTLVLADKTGEIDGKVWELNNNIQSFAENDFIKIDGDVVSFNNELQLRITKIRKSTEGEYNPQDYIPSSDKDVADIYTQLLGFIKTVSNPFIKQLLENILVKNDEIVASLKTHSAAKNMHHGYMGGLIEHILSVTQICDFMSGRYKYVNRDILIAGAMLHDIGKLYELSPFPENDYTDEGQLIGHIVMGTELITKEAANIPNFPDTLKNLMKHMLLSHHGEYEFGSPKRPKIIEAFILHCADNMDAKTKMFEEMIEKDNTQGAWMGYNKMLARYMRKTDL